MDENRVIQQAIAAIDRNSAVVSSLVKSREKLINNEPFAQQIIDVRNKFRDTYFRLTVDLSVARTNEKQAIAGAAIFVRSADDDPDSTLSLRLWRPDLPLIPVRMQTRIRAPFDEFFITNTAQAGKTLDLYISKDPDIFELIEPSSFDADILSELQGSSTGTYKNVSVTTAATSIWVANTARKSVFVQLSPAATDDVYLGFTSGVLSTNAFVRLTPGGSWSADDYRGIIQGISASGTQTVHTNEVG